MACKKRRKKPKYRKVTFKLSSRQKKSLLNYCEARRTTPVKLIKKMIRPYIENYTREVPEEYYITENQLSMFEDNNEIEKH